MNRNQIPPWRMQRIMYNVRALMGGRAIRQVYKTVVAEEKTIETIETTLGSDGELIVAE